ncbi:MAG: hypothetical protein LBR56_06295 [Sporomusaceae bacterium]|jgi:serine/threonine protein phosphatase PrpC|nr:hypothetical protein [Sporomusaceae bacterium]
MPDMGLGENLAIAVIVSAIILIIGRSRLTKKHYRLIEIGEDNSLGHEETQKNDAAAAEAAWGTLAVLAAGLGKTQAAKTGAFLTVRTFVDLFTTFDPSTNLAYFFNQAVGQSNRKILEHLPGVRTAVMFVAALINEGRLYYVSVGDIVIAVMRQGKLIRVNEGHTMETLAAKGFLQGRLTREQALTMSKIDRHTNYLGRDGFKNLESGIPEPIELIGGDIIILMTNGLYKCLAWREMETILEKPLSCPELAGKIIAAFDQKEKADKKSASLLVLRYKGL